VVPEKLNNQQIIRVPDSGNEWKQHFGEIKKVTSVFFI
jgi:hypothetical protein